MVRHFLAWVFSHFCRITAMCVPHVVDKRNCLLSAGYPVGSAMHANLFSCPSFGNHVALFPSQGMGGEQTFSKGVKCLG